MKTTRIFLVIFTISAFLSTGCDELFSDLLKFDSDWYSVEFTIDPTDEIGNIVFKSEVIEANIDSLMMENSVTEENIKSIKMSEARVTITSMDADFDPVTSVELFIETDGMERTRIAWIDTVPRGVTTVNLDLNQDDLQEYLLSNSFQVTASGVLESKVEKSVEALAEIKFLLTGGLGQ